MPAPNHQLVSLPKKFAFHTDLQFNGDFCNVDLKNASTAKDVFVSFSRGNCLRLELNPYQKWVMTFHMNEEDAVQMKELEYALQRYTNTLASEWTVKVKELNEFLNINWPKYKSEYGLLKVKDMETQKISELSLEVFKKMNAFPMDLDLVGAQMLVKVGAYLRKLEDGTHQAGLFFTLKGWDN